MSSGWLVGWLVGSFRLMVGELGCEYGFTLLRGGRKDE